MAKQNKLTVFLSHSRADIDKVRKVRDILETLNCEPLVFFLACLDDNKTELEDLIKREIAARNIFVYCESENARKSPWVQIERSYIQKQTGKRIYTLNLEEDFEVSIVALLNELLDVIRRNTVILWADKAQRYYAGRLASALKELGFAVRPFSPDFTAGNPLEYVRSKTEYLCANGILVPVLSGDWDNPQEDPLNRALLSHLSDARVKLCLPVILFSEEAQHHPITGFQLPAKQFSRRLGDILDWIVALSTGPELDPEADMY